MAVDSTFDASPRRQEASVEAYRYNVTLSVYPLYLGGRP